MAGILVTGGMGFIGSHLVDKLAECGFDVTIYDSHERMPYTPPGVDWIKGDIREPEKVREACLDKEGIIHLAAISGVSAGYNNPPACITVNIMGTINVMEGIRVTGNRAWMLLGSSREVISEPSGDYRPYDITNIYGISKLTAELCAARYARDYGLRVMTLRLSDVYGSKRDNPNKVIPKLITRALGNLDLKVQAPKCGFDFTHWRDTIDGIYLGMQHIQKVGNGYYDDFTLCTGKQTSLKELIGIIMEETGSNSKVIYPPDTTHDINLLSADAGKAKAMLNYEAKISLRQGIKETMEILKNAGKGRK